MKNTPNSVLLGRGVFLNIVLGLPENPEYLFRQPASFAKLIGYNG
ncbi:hypothetical protein L1281_000565 [Neisseria sp. HSC-16F19]|nr:hypothetical protein [Neisseria sp. HSC-16F19]MCP2039986.1 hypothetical protein [Neisseria sp. HSC-16F19]